MKYSKIILSLAVLVIFVVCLALFIHWQHRNSSVDEPTPTEVSNNTSISEPEDTFKNPKPKEVAAPQPKEKLPQEPSQDSKDTKIVDSTVCNTSLISEGGFDVAYVISREACDLVNILYRDGKAAGNANDTYENRDGLHVNFCEGWTPSPDCPKANRFFLQHEWLLSGGVGKATSVHQGVTIGQASYSGETSGDVKHSIPYSMYKTQSGADILYNQYTHNNLYIYPSLEESKKDNIANTPYVISSEDIAKAGTDYFHAHDASGSDLPFVNIFLLASGSLKPEVKQALTKSSLFMPTLQMLVRHSHQSILSEADYLNSSIVHDNTYQANYLSGGIPRPSYDPLKLVKLSNSLNISDVPPLVKMKVLSEDFQAGEKLFTTPDTIARSTTGASSVHTIKISAVDSVDLDGNKSNHVYEWRVLHGDASKIKISVDAATPGVATIEFSGGEAGRRLDVGVFVKKSDGKYYSIPGIVSVYIQS